MSEDKDMVDLRIHRWAARVLVSEAGDIGGHAKAEVKAAARKALRPRLPEGIVESLRALEDSGTGTWAGAPGCWLHRLCSLALANWIEHVLEHGWEPGQ